MSTARSLLAKQGLSPAQIEQQIDTTVKLSEQPLPTYKPPNPDTMGPATASLQRPFSDAYNDFMNRVSDSAEATVDGQVQAGKNLVGLGGPGAPGVADSWKDLAKGTATGMYEAATNPVGVATDQIKEFSNDPAAYIGKKMIEVPETLATLPLGGEGAALRAGLPGDLGDAASAGRMTETASVQLGDLAPASEHLPSVAAPVAHSPAVPPSVPEANVPRIPVVPESLPAHAVADMPGPRPALEGPIPQLADVPSQHIPEAPRTSELPHLSEAAAPLAARVPEPMTSSAAASIPDGIRASAAELAPSMASGVAHTPPIHPVEAPRSIESPQYGSGASGSGFHPPHDPPPPPHQGPDHPPSAHSPSPGPHPHADSPGDRPPAGDYHDADGQNAHHVGDDPGHHSSPWNQNVLSDDQRAEILAAEKGSRPDPSEYLPPEFIQHHLEKFSDGASRFTTSEALEDYGIGHRDGTSFVFPTRELDQLMTSTGGDRGALEAALGLPEGYLSTEGLVRVDIPDPGEYNVRVPSGNEAGANDQWIPGGFLPTGTSEAVIDGAKVPQDDLIITNMDGK